MIDILKEQITRKIFYPGVMFFICLCEVGQGLAISHSFIVEKHGGALNFETGVGKGTTFIIRLPFSPGNVNKQKRETQR